MYIHINEKYLEKNRKKAKEEAISSLYEEEKDSLLFEDLKGTIEVDEFTDGKLLVHEDNDLGYFSTEIMIDDDLAFDIIEYMKKKGEKIKRLIQLTD